MFFTSQFRRRRTLRTTLATLLLVAASSLGCASAAHATMYNVYYCTTPDGARASTSDWHATRTADGEATDACPSYYILRLGGGVHGAGEQSTVGFQAPDGVKLIAAYVERSAAILDPSGSDVNASPDFFSVFGPTSQQTGDGCAFFQTSPYTDNGTYSSPCRGVAWAGYAPGSPSWTAYWGADGVDRFAFVVGCGGSGGTCAASNVPGQSRVTLTIHEVAVTASDVDVPQIGAVSGTATDAGSLTGSRTISVGAADKGSGVYESVLAIDGTPIQTLDTAGVSTCADVRPSTPQIEFDQLQPCPLQTKFSHSFDTTKLSEGSHRLTVTVRDAAGNVSAAYEKTIVIDNVPPPSANIAPSITGGAPAGGLRPGDSLVSADGTWNGASISFAHRWQRLTDAGAWVDIPHATGATYTVTSDDVGHAIRVVVTATNSEGSTSVATEATAAVRSGATVQTQSVAPSTTPGASSSNTSVTGPVAAAGDAGGQLVLDREQKSVDVKYGAKIVITGRLVDSNNEPIANADVDVFEQLVTTTAAWNKIGTIKTDSQGGYLFRPTTTASRRLRFAWSNTIGTSDYRATREVLVSVTALMSIKAKHRVVGRHDTIKLSGRVTVAGLPKSGQWVELQVLDAGVWRTVATRKLSSKGGWTFKHRLSSSARITFAFRSRLRASGDIPAVESKSPVVKVRVR